MMNEPTITGSTRAQAPVADSDLVAGKRPDAMAATPEVNDVVAEPQRSLSWRVVDIVTCAVIGVACGVIFIAWDYTGAGLDKVLDLAIPGGSGLLLGVWLLGGILAGLIIRKPGAALIGELVAAIVELIPGNQWGLDGVLSGLVQGVGAEIVFAAVLYRRFGWPVALAAGAAAAVPEFIHTYIARGGAQTAAYNAGLFVTSVISGALAGLLAWLLMKALAKAGALSQFAAGREARGRIA